MTRCFDIVFAFCGLILLAPIFLVIPFILRFTGEGEIFYKQNRVGKGQRNFFIYKFATMVKGSPMIGSGELTQFDDSRVLPVGKFLRKTKINELPQLFNVLIGDMSLVGPRPQTLRFFALFDSEAREEIPRVRPGVTGISSLMFRDEEQIFKRCSDPVQLDDEILTPYKGSLEVWYVNNRSVYLYFKILLLTIVALLFPSAVKPHKLFSGLPDLPLAVRNLMVLNAINVKESDL